MSRDVVSRVCHGALQSRCYVPVMSCRVVSFYLMTSVCYPCGLQSTRCVRAMACLFASRHDLFSVRQPRRVAAHHAALRQVVPRPIASWTFFELMQVAFTPLTLTPATPIPFTFTPLLLTPLTFLCSRCSVLRIDLPVFRHLHNVFRLTFKRYPARLFFRSVVLQKGHIYP